MYELTNNIEKYLATLSKAYSKQGNALCATIIVNSRVRLELHTDEYYDLGRTYISHTLHLTLPESVYLEVFQRKTELESQLQNDVNSINTIIGESINRVHLDMDVPGDKDWRRESGLLVTGEKLVTPKQEERIWTKNAFKLFVSHRSSVKGNANELKQELKYYGVSAFVAHEDVTPTKDWQVEIENALASMDGFLAILSEDFHESEWTDQEVGYAIARGVPLISLMYGRKPYGFMGKFQGLKYDKNTASASIVKLLVKEPKMVAAYVRAVEECPSFDVGNKISQILSSIEEVDKEQIARLVAAFNTNGQVSGSFGFTGEKPYSYGEGLPSHLFRLSGKSYHIYNGEIVLKG